GRADAAAAPGPGAGVGRCARSRTWPDARGRVETHRRIARGGRGDRGAGRAWLSPDAAARPARCGRACAFAGAACARAAGIAGRRLDDRFNEQRTAASPDACAWRCGAARRAPDRRARAARPGLVLASRGAPVSVARA
ncbi:MAG: hypothetical protein AVDCRST_MAG71-2168, partial [uncultured Lysobacter sp.]